MKRLFTPWRYDYIVSDKDSSCIFCDAVQSADDASALVLYRADESFVMLNRYPYNNGHLLVAPCLHAPSLEETPDAVLEEMIRVLKAAQRVLAAAYRPKGFNVGMNIGVSSGAGYPDHLHLHIVPRWEGDSSFMTVVADTRVIPEDLDGTFKRLKARFEAIKSL